MDPLTGLPCWLSGKESACLCRRYRFDLWVRKIPWRREQQPSPVFLPGNFRGQRSLAGYSPWGRRRAGHDLATKQQFLIVDIHDFATFVFSLPTSFVYGCLTTFIVHLSLPLRFFLMGGASSGANKMAFQNGTCQHQCSYHRIISLQPLLMSMPLE